MARADGEIHDVSDTAIWVAYYRAIESERHDALFRDPLAKALVGERGKKIADRMKVFGRYAQWSVVMRTRIIDELIHELIAEGVDTVINLGAGLDTRPYRMNLPSTLRWIEVDQPQIIGHKNEMLKSETTRCQLTRVELDLGNDQKRQQFLHEVAASTKNALVLTEGVVPYLSEEQVANLASELHHEPSLNFWITELFSREAYRSLRGRARTKVMKNAPFRFYPDDWMGFFAARGWVAKQIRYTGEEGAKHGRHLPSPWWMRLLGVLRGPAARAKSQRMSGYVLFQKSGG